MKIKARTISVGKVFSLIVGLILLAGIGSGFATDPGNKAGALKKGGEIFARAVEAMGGAEKIATIKNSYYKIQMRRFIAPDRTSEMDVETVYEYPTRYYYSAILKGQKVVMKLDGDKGWIQAPPKNEYKEMEPENVKYVKPMVERDPICMLQNPGNYTIAYVGKKDFAGTPALDLEIKGPTTHFHLYLDAATHLILGYSYQEEIPGVSKGMVDEEEIWSQYKDIEGVKLPFKILLNIDGKKSAEANVQEIKFNIKTGDEFFRPDPKTDPKK